MSHATTIKSNVKNIVFATYNRLTSKIAESYVTQGTSHLCQLWKTASIEPGWSHCLLMVYDVI